jgi:BirA family biotin operon repressor/biotin-[acetyl-CoA-carboxylase] ligase
VREVAETGSTNADLLAVADRAADRTVLRADHQTAGRGRLDRRWDAPPGTNLLVSLLFTDVPGHPSELTRRVGLAIVGAARRVSGVAATLKWPNDVLVDDAKAAGILAQIAPDGAVVVGAGVNLRWAPDGAARLGDVEPGAFLAAVLEAYDGLPDDISDRYRSVLSTIGRRVRIERPMDAIVGTAVDVDEAGRLTVIDECAISHHVDAGDVVHLRPA